MNLGQMHLALKMIREEYRLSESQILILSRRMMADEREFEKMWTLFKNRRSDVDTFKDHLKELLT